MFDLTGKGAVVTGGASGIGEAIAKRLAAAGARVLVADVTDASEAVAAWGGHFIRADVSNPAEIEAMLDRAIALFGALDILVNNAGIAVSGAIEDTGNDMTARLHGINTMGVLYGMREAAKRMQSGSVIINTASVAGVKGIPGLVEYSMGKAAIVQATKVAALDLGLRNIRVNAICPGIIVTPLLLGSDAPLARVAGTVVPLARAGSPEDVAALAHFLASDDAAYITGQAICTDGGWTAGDTVQTMGAALAAG